MKNYNQLELFQSANDYEQSIFNRAKKIKQIGQGLYKDANKLFSAPENELSEIYCTLKIDVSIDQIRDKDSLEPGSPKMFIWKFIPSISIEFNGKTEVLLKEGDAWNDFIGPKIIPKWVNEHFTTNVFSHADFLQLTRQYFTLDLTIKILEDKEIMREINKYINDKHLLVYFESKLFPNSSYESESVLESDIVNKVNNFFFKLKNMQKENWFYIGGYDDFTRDNNLLTDLDGNYVFVDKKNANEELSAEGDLLVKCYQHDYLFLNNAEFFYQEKINTDSWENNYIVPPDILKDGFAEIDETKFNIKNGEEYERREVYFYFRKGAGEKFYRADLLLPPKDITSEELINILLHIPGLKNEKGH